MRKRIKLYVSAFRNICYTYNYAEFDKNVWILPSF